MPRGSSPFRPRAGESRDRLTPWLLRCGELAGPLFVANFWAEGARRRTYEARRHPVSALALGDRGWAQTANFFVAGALTCAFAPGTRRALSRGPGSSLVPCLTLLVGLCLLGCGLFATDAVGGYPPGGSAQPPRPTRSGILHDLLSLPMFLAVPLGCLACCRRAAGAGEWIWSGYSAATAVAVCAGFGLAAAGFNQVPGLRENAGLFQRAAIMSGFGWMSLFALRLRRQAAPPPPS